MKKFFPLFAMFILFACAGATPPTSSELENADYGSYPANYKKILENKIKMALIDEDSAKFRYSGDPLKAWKPLTNGNGYVYGWDVCVEVNAKNRMGGYVGYKPYYAFIKNGNVLSLVTDFPAEVTCSKWGWA